MPLVSRTFDQLIDFTRTSAATFVGSNGLLQTTALSKNVFIYTQDFDLGTWTKTRVTVAANAAAAPDSTPTADMITATNTLGTHSIYIAATNLTSGTQWTASVYAKAGTHSFLQLAHNSSVNLYANFNLATGAVGNVGSSVTSTAISSVGDGWYRCSMTFTPGSSNVLLYLAVTSATSAWQESWTPAGTETFYLWGAQAEAAASATSYARNYGGLYPPRMDFNPATLAPRGFLVEEQRTNLAIYSSDFTNAAWVKTSTTAAMTATGPDGAANSASTLTASGTNGTALQTITSASAARSTTCYVKRRTGTGTIEMTQDNGGTWTTVSVTSDWTRVSIPSATVTNPVVGFRIATNGDAIDVYGFQCETGAFATSVIPTVASQVTRTADNSLIQAPNFAPWYNQAAGTFVIEFTPDATVASGTRLAATSTSNGSSARVIDIHTSSTNWQSYNGTGNVVTGAAAVTSTTQKIAAAFAAGDYAICLNGGTIGLASSSTLNSPTQLAIGYLATPQNYLNGHIRAITFYPTRLPNGQLQSITA